MCVSVYNNVAKSQYFLHLLTFTDITDLSTIHIQALKTIIYKISYDVSLYQSGTDRNKFISDKGSTLSNQSQMKDFGTMRISVRNI